MQTCKELIYKSQFADPMCEYRITTVEWFQSPFHRFNEFNGIRDLLEMQTEIKVKLNGLALIARKQQ